MSHPTGGVTPHGPLVPPPLSAVVAAAVLGPLLWAEFRDAFRAPERWAVRPHQRETPGGPTPLRVVSGARRPNTPNTPKVSQRCPGATA